jgi:hypothetical protein
MKNIIYNDTEFSVAKTTCGWSITRKLPNGALAVVAANLFADLPDGDAEARALALVRTVFPTGIRIVGPDVAHPNMVGDLKIVGPDVSYPNFIYWNKDSTSLAK